MNQESTKAGKETDWGKERQQVQRVFAAMLYRATGDGSKKRQAGSKPPWWCDPDHEPAIFSHLNKWKHGEIEDADSGVHPLVHLAWRALALAYQETYGRAQPHSWFPGNCPTDPPYDAPAS